MGKSTNAFTKGVHRMDKTSDDYKGSKFPEKDDLKKTELGKVDVYNGPAKINDKLHKYSSNKFISDLISGEPDSKIQGKNAHGSSNDN